MHAPKNRAEKRPSKKAPRRRTRAQALRRVLLMPDLHAPRHDRRAWACFLDVCRRWRPHVVVCLGDFADCAPVSRHSKDPRRVLKLSEELAGVRTARAELDAALKAGGCREKHMVFGNHDQWIDRYASENAPALVEAGLVAANDNAYGLGPEWQITPYKESLQLGHLRITHDLERSGASAVRQNLVDAGENIVTGHTHRLSVHYGGTVFGRKLVSATLGWLGDEAAIEYRHRDKVKREWQHGFGAAYMLADGRFWLNPVAIVEGECVLDGVLYSHTRAKAA